MRWVRYRRTPDGVVRVGVLDGDTIHGTEHTSLVAATRAGFETRESVPLVDVTLLAPVETPPSIRDFMVFEQHVAGMGLLVAGREEVPDVWYRQPLFYFSNPTAVTGPYDDVPVPPGCEVFDFELEVAALVGPLDDGRPLADLTLDEARRSIVGLMLMNDWSARDLQAAEMTGPLGPCKGKDSAITLGPWLVTLDELDDLDAIELRVSVNGNVVGEDRLGSMAWSFAEMVSYASRGTVLQPGDVLGSGTCGSGCLAEHWGRRGRGVLPPLKPGDLVEMSGGPLGVLRNQVVAGSPVRQPLAVRSGLSVAAPTLEP